jgi:hypothetical protein
MYIQAFKRDRLIVEGFQILLIRQSLATFAANKKIGG